MAKKPVVGTVSTGIHGLNDFPFGSLLLIASHHRKWRDETLIDATIYGALDVTVCYLALSELVGLPKLRFQDRLSVLCDQWASDEAMETCGKEPFEDPFMEVRGRNLFDRSRDAPVHDEAAAKEEARQKVQQKQEARQKYERDHAAWTVKFDSTKKGALARFKKKAEAFAVTFQAVKTLTIDGVLEQIKNMPPGCIVVVDDLAAIRKSEKQSGSLKLCCDHARALKDIAIQNGILLVVGMPTTEVRDKRANTERAMTLDDFGPYGSPDAVADAVVIGVPFYGDRGWTVADRILFSRY